MPLYSVFNKLANEPFFGVPTGQGKLEKSMNLIGQRKSGIQKVRANKNFCNVTVTFKVAQCVECWTCNQHAVDSNSTPGKSCITTLLTLGHLVASSCMLYDSNSRVCTEMREIK